MCLDIGWNTACRVWYIASSGVLRPNDAGYNPGRISCSFLYCAPDLTKPAKTAVSPRSSPLTDVSRGITSATQRQKFHTDDVKSVRNSVRSADWSTE